MDLLSQLLQERAAEQAPRSRMDLTDDMEAFTKADSMTLSASVSDRRELMRQQVAAVERVNAMIDSEAAELAALGELTPAVREFIKKIRAHRVIVACQHCGKICI